MQNIYTESLEQISSRLQIILEEKHSAREKALKITRDIIQMSSRSIRAMHRSEIQNAQEFCSKARAALDEIKTVLHPHPDLYYSGYVLDAQKEYVEAKTVLSLLSFRPIDSPETLGVEASAYLNGIAEAASEVRRHLLDCLREGRMEMAETLLSSMDAIYDVLILFDYPDAITGGLRRSTDSLRAVLERSRADLTLTITQARLQSAIEQSFDEETRL